MDSSGHTTAFVTVVGLLAGGLACVEQDCTLLACESGLRLTIEAELPATEDSYQITIEADGETHTTECRQDTDSCTFDSPEGSEFSPWIRSGPHSFEIQIGSPTDSSGPAHVEVSIALGTESWVESFDPDYETSEPNGAGCGTCDFAAEIMNIVGVNN